MTKLRMLTLLIILGHWVVAIWHLFVAANVLPVPNNHVGSLAVTLISAGHLIVSIAVWKLSPKLAGAVALIFFLAAMSADLYEHFLHASGNNVFMVAPGGWTAVFDVSVMILLALEIAGCLLGTMSLGGRKKNNSQPPVPNPKPTAGLSGRPRKLSAV